MTSSFAVANAFIRIADQKGAKLTNMQLQKLVYFAHGWYLAHTREALIGEQIKAWTFGPVIPPLYNRLKKFGNGIVSEQIETETEIAHDSHLSKFLLRVWEVYGHMTGAQLSYLTHMPETPWAIVWAKERFGVIPNDEIRKHFSGLMAQ